MFGLLNLKKRKLEVLTRRSCAFLSLDCKLCSKYTLVNLPLKERMTLALYTSNTNSRITAAVLNNISTMRLWGNNTKIKHKGFCRASFRFQMKRSLKVDAIFVSTFTFYSTTNHIIHCSNYWSFLEFYVSVKFKGFWMAFWIAK